MRITVEIPDKSGGKFNKKEREKIVINALKNKIKPKKSLKEESFFKWALSKKKSDNIEIQSDVSRNQDKDYSFTDCTSFAFMKEKGIKKAFAFDDHFKQYGFELVK